MPKTELIKHRPDDITPTATALMVIDRFVTRMKEKAAIIQYGSVGIECTIHAGQIVKVDISERHKTDVTMS